jgi:hypothetical protein
MQAGIRKSRPLVRRRAGSRLRFAIRRLKLAPDPAHHSISFQGIRPITIDAPGRPPPRAAGRQHYCKIGPAFGASRSLRLSHRREFAARTAARPFQMKFNRENILSGLGQPSADPRARRSSLGRAAQPTGHPSRMRETGADAADDEDLRAPGPSNSPPESPSQATDLCFRSSTIS